MRKIKKTQEFEIWLDSCTEKERSQVMARLDKIENYDHLGDAKNLRDGLCELRWKNGRRLYFVIGLTGNIILLLGGNKNEQEKNIKRARTQIKRYTAR